jgi:alkaline phosphatase D
LALVVLAGVPGPEAQAAAPAAPVLTHGVASGDLRETSAMIWARASGTARMHVQVSTSSRFRRARTVRGPMATSATDFTATARIRRLRPGTRYHYRVWFSRAGRRSRRANGTLRTPPSSSQQRPVRFVASGDLGGSGHCRNAKSGYAAFSSLRGLAADFFLATGDMIYADHSCPAQGPAGSRYVAGNFPAVTDATVSWTDRARLREIYRRHWRYNRADPSFRAFLARTPIYSQWDDHEVINDFGGGWSYWNSANATRAGFPNLVAEGRAAFFNYGVVERSGAEPNRIYRAFRWGRDVALFLLDARSYRSRNDLPDTVANNKTLLGAAQLAWLKGSLRASTATWKIVAGEVPISLPSGDPTLGRDNWADGGTGNGFERELLDLLASIDSGGVKNVVFVAGDAHIAASLRYEGDYNGDGDTLLFHEFVSGPLSAGTGSAERQLDPTAMPRFLYREGGIFNSAYVRVARARDGKVHLVADVRDARARVRPGSTVDLTPQ